MLRVSPQLALLWASPGLVAVASAALLAAVICTLLSRRSRRGFAAAFARVFLVALGAVLSGAFTWALYAGLERNALETRVARLTGQALVPGSPLACLDALTGDTVQAACETAIFASPASVASAVDYVAAEFALLSDVTDYARRAGPNVDDVLVPLRHTLEADPFGLLAHVLVMRGCTSENCPPLTLLRDPRHVRTNIIAQTLDHYVDHYRAVWAKSTDLPGEPVAEAAGTEAGRRRVPVDIAFPTAASIPPVSIMNPEPRAAANAEAARKEKSRNGVDPVWTPAPAQAAR